MSHREKLKELRDHPEQINPATAIKLLDDYEKMREALEVSLKHVSDVRYNYGSLPMQFAMRPLNAAIACARECLAGLQIGKGEG
jgi:hypothetical protein